MTWLISYKPVKLGLLSPQTDITVLCYADDILLCSTTPTGLQDLINTANKYINENGLRFNPTKTSCLLVGKNPFTSMPEWVIDGTPINIVDKISYLGSEFGDLNGDAHCVQRVRKATRALFGLQGAGVKYPGVQPHSALEFCNTAIRSVIGYGCSSIYITKKNINLLEKLQNKFILQCIGLHTNSHITPVLKAMGISPISTSVAMESLDLIKKCVLNNSIARDFYCKTLFMPVKSIHGKTLSDRVLQFAVNNNINILKKILVKNMAQILKIVLIEELRMERMVLLTVFGGYLIIMGLRQILYLILYLSLFILELLYFDYCLCKYALSIFDFIYDLFYITLYILWYLFCPFGC